MTMIRPLREVTDAIMLLAVSGERSAVEALLYDVVRERTRMMHERAQAAEGRAFKAERMIERYSHHIAEHRP